MTVRPINADTSRITQLIQTRPGSAEESIVRRLQRGDIRLVICITRITELARLPDSEKASLVSFLRDAATLIGQPEDVLVYDELACACAKATGLSRRPPKPFARESGDWGTVINAPDFSAADLLELATAGDEIDRGFRRVAADHIPIAKRLRMDAAIVKDPAIQVKVDLDRHLLEMRTRLPSYAADLSATEIIDRVGGVEAFPALYIPGALLRARLTRRIVGEPNDVLDEDISRFHQYSVASVLDHATKDRFWEANLPGRERVASKWSEALTIIDRVEDGELAHLPFYLPA